MVAEPHLCCITEYTDFARLETSCMSVAGLYILSVYNFIHTSSHSQ